MSSAAETSSATRINPVVELRRDGEIAVLSVNSPPVNALSAQVRELLGATKRT